MPKKTIKRIPIKPPAGVKKGKAVKRGGFLPAAAIPLLAAAGVPLATSAGKWIGRKIFGQGVIRAGATRAQGGKKTPTRRIIVRV